MKVSSTETSHVGHVAYFVLVFLIGTVVGYYVGYAYQNANNTEDQATNGVNAITNGKPAPKKITVSSSPTATTSATASPLSTVSPTASASPAQQVILLINL